jgi:hypothetical protein
MTPTGEPVEAARKGLDKAEVFAVVAVETPHLRVIAADTENVANARAPLNVVGLDDRNDDAKPGAAHPLIGEGRKLDPKANARVLAVVMLIVG